MKLEYEVEGGEKKRKSLAPANEVKHVVVANWGPVPRDGSWLTIGWNKRLSDFAENYDTVISEESKLITAVNLSSLSSCRKIEELIIVGNDLKEIDLSPLSNFTHLKLLDLRFNNLEEVDLTPLAACRELSEINLSHNQLREVDLSSLSRCKDLEILNLSHNELKELDLTAISACPKLTELHLDRNQIERLDLSSLAFCPVIGRVDLDKNKISHLSLYPLIECNELWNPENMDPGHLRYPFTIKDNPIKEIDVSPLLLRGDHILRSSSSLKRRTLKIFAPFYYRLMRKSSRCRVTDFSVSISDIPWNELQKLLRINLDILNQNERSQFIDLLLREMGFKSHSWENSDIDNHLLSLPSDLEYQEVIDEISIFLEQNHLPEKQSKSASSIYPFFEYTFEDIKSGNYPCSSSAPIPDIPKLSELTFVVDNGIRAYENLSPHWIRNCYDKYTVPADEVPLEEMIEELGESGDPEAPLI
ncbi:MAG: hypothetical protein GF309_10020, partial [Candidatus Lokiarchaeota archaeon]|nr:hypothetical protein [Candidatus Lokiarchaeota archaeon]